MIPLEGLDFSESAEFGTGAVSQAAAPDGGVVFLTWLLDYDGQDPASTRDIEVTVP